jgi:hypothetical protein
LGGQYAMKLIIFRRSAEKEVELEPGNELYLDRRFLTGGDIDNRVSQRGNAPKLFFADGGWMVFNQSETATLVLTRPNERSLQIGPRMSWRLDDGYSQMWISDCAVGLQVDGVHTPPAPPPAPGPPTQPLDGARVKSVQERLAAKPTERTIMYVRFQQYISDQPVHVRNPRPLEARQVLECFPDAVALSVIHEAQRQLNKLTGLSLEETGSWLVQYGILHPRHRIDTPHVNCGHRRRVP